MNGSYNTKFNGIKITDEMKERALKETKKRNPDIVHHFKTQNYSQTETDQIGFYGEFAFRMLMNVDWKDGIRTDYKKIDSKDVEINGWAIDVKTETIPEPQIWQVLDKSIKDNIRYGRRLIHTGQGGLLSKYDIIVMGAIHRQPFTQIDYWYPIGWMNAENVKTYPRGKKGPLLDNGNNIWYPFSAYQITTVDLQPISELHIILQNKR